MSAITPFADAIGGLFGVVLVLGLLYPIIRLASRRREPRPVVALGLTVLVALVAAVLIANALS